MHDAVLRARIDQMSKKDRVFLIVFIGLFAGYLVVEYMAPKPLEWRITFHQNDKNPFGGYVLNQRMEDLFNFSETGYLTLTEFSARDQNPLILAHRMDLTETDTDHLEQMLNGGRHVLLAAHQFPAEWLDSLGLKAEYSFSPLDESIFQSQRVQLTHQNGASARYMSPLVPAYFTVENRLGWNPVVWNEDRHPLVVSKQIGKGKLILCSAPLLFTNFGLLHQDNYTFAQEILRELPEDNIHLSYYYQLGRPEPQTPFRYILTQAPLRWALYLGLALLLVFFIVETRRRQREIPVLSPPENTTVEYVRTLGNLYFQQGNHQNLAEKMIRHFIHRVKEKYHLGFQPSEQFYHLLSVRSELPLEEIVNTCDEIQKLRNQHQLTGAELLGLAKKINRII